VGLQNLGATCYANALLQQFFLIPEFRYYILNTSDFPSSGTEVLPEIKKNFFTFTGTN